MNILKDLITASLLLLLPLINKAQNIYTIAGNGNFGYSGDGEAATTYNVEMNGPSGIFIDKASNIYIAEEYNNVIRKIDAFGNISTVAGNHYLGDGYSGDNGQATNAQINIPCGVFVDTIGNIYIADNGNMVIRRVNTSGIISTIVGNAHKGFSGDGGPASAAELSQPVDVFVTPKGEMFIIEYSGQRIRKVATDGIISTVAGNGIEGYSGDGGPATAAEMAFPLNLYVDSFNNIYFPDENAVIRKVDNSGIISTIAGIGTNGFSGDGGPATDAELGAPTAMWMDKANNIYLSEAGNQRIRKIDALGIISTIAGNGFGGGLGGYSGDGGTATSSELKNPWGIGLDGYGNIFFSDQVAVIREIKVNSGINNLVVGNIALYPNPTDKYLNIYFPNSDEPYELNIYNEVGQKLYKENIKEKLSTINVQGFSAGPLFINIRTKNQNFNYKLLKL